MGNTMDNTIIEAMKTRRSCRAFKADPLPRELVEQVAEAGLWAASGMGRQSVRIVAVTDKALRDRFAEANRAIGGWPEGFDPFYGAPVILAVVADQAVPTAVYDGSLALGNLMLAAHSLGLASIWIHRAKEEFESDEGKAFLKSLGFEGDWVGVGHCALGYAADPLPPPPPRRPGRIVWA